jgi:imidazole glycerol-phosphate synthase subunit HisH
MPTPTVAVLDYGSGNVRSAVRALEAQGAEVELTRDPQTVRAADGLVVPGVGAFSATADALRAVGAPALIEQRLAAGRPVLGICVGMQVLFETGDEHGTVSAGLDQWPGTVSRLEAPVVPHMGWNTVEPGPGTRLFAGLEDQRFYFVHSYAAHSWDRVHNPPLPDAVVTWAEHGERFVAAVEDGPLTATQFHPEKSGEAGARLLRNWLDTIAPRATA